MKQLLVSDSERKLVSEYFGSKASKRTSKAGRAARLQHVSLQTRSTEAPSPWSVWLGKSDTHSLSYVIALSRLERCVPIHQEEIERDCHQHQSPSRQSLRNSEDGNQLSQYKSA